KKNPKLNNGAKNKQKIKEMQASFFFNNNLANALHFFFRFFLIQIAAILLFYAAAFSPFTYYIQSIGSSINICSDYGSTMTQFLISSLPLIKPKRLKNKEKAAFSIPSHLTENFLGLLLGDLYGRYRYGNTRFVFKQGLIHKDYLYHLYELFSLFCPSEPKIFRGLLDTRTGKIYSSISFSTYTLPCFNELYHLFYLSGKKVIPNNIEDLLTPLSLAYWIADDGSWNKPQRYVSLSTESFTLAEVELLIKVLNTKFNLSCYKSRNGVAYKIIIPSYSVPV
uniref:LAGLIDADG endonuclease n=1 Tax=Ramaria cf. rubripermanens TaxID=2016387 RepID=UPI0022374588